MVDRIEAGGRIGADSTRVRARRVLLRLHRIVGLIAGAVFVLVALSGGLLAFRDDIDEALNASIMRVEPLAAPRPLDEIVAAAVAALPPEARLERLTTPRHPRAAAALTYVADTEDLDTYVYELFVDPYRAKVTGRRLLLHGSDTFSQPFIQILMAFHWTLLLGVNNAWMVGCVAILVFVSVLVGLYLWLPQNGDWRMGLRIKRGASPERRVLDIHRSVGIYAAALLIVMLTTGAAMIFKPATRAVLALVSPAQGEPDFGQSTPLPDRPPIGIGAAVAVADRAYPDGRLHWVLFPGSPTGVYVVGKRSDDEPNRSKTYRNVGIDQYSGAILQTQDRRAFGGGDRVLEWLFPLHSGEVFGDPGKPLMLALGVVPFALYVTGFLRWRQKRRARSRPAR